MTKQVWLYALIALFVCAAIVGVAVAFTSTASAAEINQGTPDKQGTVNVTYTVGEAWVVSISESSLALTPDKESSFTVQVTSALVENGKHLSVTVSSENYNSGWKLVNSGDALAYSLKKDTESDDLQNNATIISGVDHSNYSGQAGSVTLKAKIEQAAAGAAIHSGTYSDTLTFTVKVD